MLAKINDFACVLTALKNNRKTDRKTPSMESYFWLATALKAELHFSVILFFSFFFLNGFFAKEATGNFLWM